jgi:hypothetical protein
MLEQIHLILTFSATQLSFHAWSDTSLRLIDRKAHDHPKETKKDGLIPYVQAVLHKTLLGHLHAANVASSSMDEFRVLHLWQFVHSQPSSRSVTTRSSLGRRSLQLSVNLLMISKIGIQ